MTLPQEMNERFYLNLKKPNTSSQPSWQALPEVGGEESIDITKAAGVALRVLVNPDEA